MRRIWGDLGGGEKRAMLAGLDQFDGAAFPPKADDGLLSKICE